MSEKCEWMVMETSTEHQRGKTVSLIMLKLKYPPKKPLRVHVYTSLVKFATCILKAYLRLFTHCNLTETFVRRVDVV